MLQRDLFILIRCCLVWWMHTSVWAKKNSASVIFWWARALTFIYMRLSLRNLLMRTISTGIHQCNYFQASHVMHFESLAWKARLKTVWLLKLRKNTHLQQSSHGTYEFLRSPLRRGICIIIITTTSWAGDITILITNFQFPDSNRNENKVKYDNKLSE